MPFDVLEQHPERERLMSIAFTLQDGQDRGEHLMQCNPEFIRRQKDRQDQLTKANKVKNGKARI